MSNFFWYTEKKQEAREVKYRRAVEFVAIRMEACTPEPLAQALAKGKTCAPEPSLTVVKGRTGRTLNMNTPEKTDQASYASSGKRASVDGQNL